MNVPRAVKRVVWPRPVTWVLVIVCIFIIVAAGENDDVAMTFRVLESVCNVARETLVYQQMDVVSGTQLQILFQLPYRILLGIVSLWDETI